MLHGGTRIAFFKSQIEALPGFAFVEEVAALPEETEGAGVIVARG